MVRSLSSSSGVYQQQRTFSAWSYVVALLDVEIKNHYATNGGLQQGAEGANREVVEDTATTAAIGVVGN